MMRRSIKSLVYSGAGRLEAASSVALIFLAALLKWDPVRQPLPAWLAGPVSWLYANGLYVILALTVTSGLSKLVRQRMTRPSLQEEVCWMLDHLQRLLFRDEHRKGDPGHLHRVTLFRLQSRFLQRLDRFVIEFRYPSDEPWRRVPDPARHVSFRLGRNSRRLYALEVDLNAAKEKWVSLVVQAIEEQKKVLRDRWRRNYDIASNLVQERAPQLLAAA